MEGLKELAESTFAKVQQFRDPGCEAQFPVVEIGAFPESHFSFNEWLVFQDDLSSFMKKPPINGGDQSADASLKLVCVPRHLDEKSNVNLGISKGSFVKLIDAMSADPCVLYLITRDYDGYHEFNGAESPVTTFIGSPAYALIWVFDRKKMTTRGLCLQRRPDPWSGLRDVLRLYKSYIFSPNLLSFVSCLHLLQYFDTQTNEGELCKIREIEASTGFPPYPGASDSGSRRFSTNQLTHWSQVAGQVQDSMANKLRHLKTLKETQDLIQLEYQTKVADVVAPEFLDRYHRSMEALVYASPAIERRMKAYEEFLIYLKDRASRLSAVVSILLTHESTETNTQLTASTTSLAASSTHDSSSMKTIAAMTMAFLPATFFASLFAPSLQWDGQVVIQRNFWAYWAFTLPATAGVFLVWLGVTAFSSRRQRDGGQRSMALKMVEDAMD